MMLFGTPPVLRRMMPRGLLGRSLLILVLPMLLLQAVTSLVFYDRHWDTVMRRLASGIAGDVAMVLDLMHRFPDPDDRAWVYNMARRNLSLRIDVRPGDVLPNAENAFGGDSLERVMAASLAERIRRPVTIEAGILNRDLEIYVQLSEGVLHITAPRKRLFSSTTYVFVMWMVGTAMLLVGIATIFLSRQVRSIRRLAVSADGFGKGRDLPPIKPEGAREVRQAAQAFNVMRERIQRMVGQRTEMLAGVSHDLRTPLTRMKLQLAMMGDRPEVADLTEDVSEMQRMVEGYLAFARGEGTEAVVDTDLVALVAAVVGRMARDGGADRLVLAPLPAAVAGGLVLPLRRNAMERCLSNLLANALRYGSRVRVTLAVTQTRIEVTVEDDGPGIPDGLREDVFRPFFRGEPSRNQQTGGTGLGLTIARDVARVHGGDIVLAVSGDLGGLCAILRLPL
jgi:two-component system osmolarity sensor histidine kinase EnvZ